MDAKSIGKRLVWKKSGAGVSNGAVYFPGEVELVPLPTKQTSDGGPSAYYIIPEGAKELNDLIEHKKMDFATGNIFKAAYRLGEKAGNDHAYDLRKIIYFAERLLKKYSSDSSRNGAPNEA